MEKRHRKACAAACFFLGIWTLAGCRTMGEREVQQTGSIGAVEVHDSEDVNGTEVITEYAAEEAADIYAASVIAGEIPELSGTFSAILSGGRADLFMGYTVDESFLLWFTYRFGTEATERLASYVQSGTDGEEIWYNLTENTLHVLWLEYCRDLNYSSYLLRDVTWVDCADSDVVTMDFIGDINFSEEWYTTSALDARGGDLTGCIDPAILSELSSADITMANNEFTFSTGGTAIEGKPYVFRADPLRVSYYEAMGVDIVSLANNHTWDYGEEAFFDTIETLDEAGILTVGAGEDLTEASRVKYFIANGRKIAIVSATEIERYNNYTQGAAEDRAGVLKTQESDVFLNVIREAKAQSDYVIAYVHWGTEGDLYPEADVKSLAEQFVNAGADAVIGGHSHRLQGMTFVNDVPVVYSLGNFWFSSGDLYTAVLQLTINKFGELAVSYLPCEQKDLTVSFLTDAGEVDEFFRYVADLSTRVGFDAGGTAYNRAHTVEKVQLNYLSGVDYALRSGGVDLEGNGIDIVGNLK